MSSFFSLNIDYIENIFWFFAIAGTSFFILKALSFAVGSFGEHSMTDDVASDTIDHGSDSNHAFKIISIHSLTGFFMMFGWVGLASYKQFMLSSELSTFIAFIAGCFMLLTTHVIFKTATSLTSPGSKFLIEQLVGKTGTVYQQIPGNGGIGKIQISTNGLLREVKAVSQTNKKIDSFVAVEVTRIAGEGTVAVRKINK